MSVQYNLVIQAEHEIPPDVLVEHIGYALRTGFKLSGPFNVGVSVEPAVSIAPETVFATEQDD